MEPGIIPRATRDLAKPRDWNEQEHGECGSLLVRDDTLQGQPVMLSRWVPTPVELRMLNAGGSVELMIVGQVHPPVSLVARGPGEP
jgi:hypothetical protein